MKFRPEVLTAMREQAGLTKPELARKAGIGVNTIYTLERGDHAPRQAVVSKIADALGVEWQVFFDPAFLEKVTPSPAA